MKYIEEFRNLDLAQGISRRLSQIARKEITLMEVCGTHTVSIFRYGLKKLLPKNIRLLSGPGCPVCVTPNSYLDKAFAYAREKDFIITTFGDMVKVPGSRSSLERERAEGCDIRVVYSARDALKIASENKKKKIIFLGVGFETTAPTIAASIIEAKKLGLKNFFVFSAHKVIPPPMEALVRDGEVRLTGFICPGHVSVIIGSKPYEPISEKYKIPCVIAGFEPLDVLQAIYLLTNQIEKGEARVDIQYRRSVREEGNPKALGLMYEVFETRDTEWRGLGIIPDSGLKIKDKYAEFNIEKHMDIEVTEPVEESKGCICGDILKGLKTPLDCKLFRRVCNPSNPLGACMVSTEGTCAAYYKYPEYEE